MKKFALFITVLICACASFKHPDINESKKIVESLIEKENSGDYRNMNIYYTDDFNREETPEARATKFKTLHDVLGNYSSAECVVAKDSTDLNDFPSVYLQYKVKHSKLISVENFMVIREQGTLKVELHNIMQETK